MSDCEKPTIIDKFQYLPVSQQRKTDNEEMARLNYMTSRLRAALCKWAISALPPEAVQWWWMGLQNELDVVMGIIGYNAAYYNIFLDIPNFLRGLSQSIHSNGGPEFTLSKAMWQEIEHIPDPQDPTEVFEEYYNDWWNREDQWQSHPQVRVDGEKAFSWHIFKYGALQLNKHTSPGAGTAPPDTTARNTCKSVVCKERLHSVLGEVVKANQTFATSFMKGAGMVDGEILETLWSTLNSISPSMRTASVAHRSEVLDDHMNDSNWKKIVSITRTIINKYNRAIKNELDSTAYFQDLSTVPTAEQMALWEKEISEAEVLRTKCPAEMNVMAPHIKKGVAAETAWLMAGLKLEEQHRMRHHPTAENISSLGKQRDNLVKSMSKFNTESQKYLGEAFMECVRLIELGQTDFEEDWDPIDPPEIPADAARPELFSIAPSLKNLLTVCYSPGSWRRSLSYGGDTPTIALQKYEP
ncbi:hypothetical protein BYT27DRAFT_7248439 [Phlegmacium glaucopus]|nr:hypothetical protein BYT27DRAFT_7248439 [Phlegmacium glaucopus]